MSTGAQATLPPESHAVFETIREFLTRSSSMAGAEAITMETPLLEGSALDSLGIMQLVVFVGETFDIEVTDEDFTPDNFETVGSLVTFAMEKKKTTA